MSISPTLIWAIVGLVLVVAELLTTTFFLLFFGVSAFLVAIIKLFGLANLTMEIIVFALLGVAGTLLFRSRIVRTFKSPNANLSDRDKTLVLTENLPAGKRGKTIYQGSPWEAINNTNVDMNAGDEVVIENIEGIKLILKQK